MIGTNSLHLNEATMIEAAQEWLDKRMLNEKQKITSIKVDRINSSQTFEISMETKEAT